jgi:hypothetical protein
MTIQQPVRKFTGPAFCLLLLTSLAACSGESADNDQNTGGTGTAGSSAGSGGSGGTPGSSGSSNTPGGSSGSGATGSNEIVGTFTVNMRVDDEMASAFGQVNDGPTPPNVLWTTTKTEGDCHLEEPSQPFCEEGCDGGVCVADGKCTAYPTLHSVGEVSLKGVHLIGGATELTLKDFAKSYQAPAGTNLAYPPFTADDMVELHATGGDYMAFDLSAPGVDPIDLASPSFDLDPSKPFELTWNAGKDPKAAKVHVKLDISHHGGAKGLIECQTDDTGKLTIPATLISDLIGLGVAGFPTVLVTRKSVDTAKIAPGIVQLELSAQTEHYVTTPGVISCTTKEDCPEGKTCRTTDSTCQ